jgi:UDP-N-acetylglucosamine 1-carboxyvinyltransferase
VEGVEHLRPAMVEASDIRAGAALVLAALAADGVSRVRGEQHLRRGYENMLTKLQALGARIWEEEG